MFAYLFQKKKPLHGSLSYSEKEGNRNIVKDRVVVEHLFGSLTSLWAVLSNGFKFREELYDFIYKFCAALTNQHIVLHPICAKDVLRYKLHYKQLYRNSILSINKKHINKHFRQLCADLPATQEKEENGDSQIKLERNTEYDLVVSINEKSIQQ